MDGEDLSLSVRNPMSEGVLRFIIGGAFISAFAALGDVLKPKSFAGLFGAAPSLALASLVITIVGKGASYSSIEARSMVAGAIAFFAYAGCVKYVLMRYSVHVAVAASIFILLWLGTSLSIWAICLR